MVRMMSPATRNSSPTRIARPRSTAPLVGLRLLAQCPGQEAGDGVDGAEDDHRDTHAVDAGADAVHDLDVGHCRPIISRPELPDARWASSNVAEVTESIRSGSAPIEVRQLDTVEYRTAWRPQRELAGARAAGVPTRCCCWSIRPSTPPAGAPKRTSARWTGHRWSTPTAAARSPGTARVSLVGYPIIRLAEPLDVVNYVRRLEEALITVCGEVGLDAGRIEGRSGVWVPGRPARKVAAMGVRVARATTLHGFALNCDCDLDAFSAIVPCGISDAGVTSLSAELHRPVTVAEVRAAVADAVCAALDGLLPVREHRAARVTSSG